jgi:hypothetical protein
VVGVWGRPAAFWAATVVAGLLVGIASLLAHEYLPPGPDLLGNSAAIWLALAFFAGFRARSAETAVAAGTLFLVTTLVTFYVMLPVLFGRADFPAVERFWLIAALVGGPVYGGLGWLARAERAVLRGLAAAALGAVFVSEAVAYGSTPVARWSLVAEAAFGLLVPLAFVRTRAQAAATLAWFPAFLVAGSVCWAATTTLFQRLP